MWVPDTHQHADEIRVARAAAEGAERRAELEREHEASMARLKAAQEMHKNFACMTKTDAVGVVPRKASFTMAEFKTNRVGRQHVLGTVKTR